MIVTLVLIIAVVVTVRIERTARIRHHHAVHGTLSHRRRGAHPEEAGARWNTSESATVALKATREEEGPESGNADHALMLRAELRF